MSPIGQENLRICLFKKKWLVVQRLSAAGRSKALPRQSEIKKICRRQVKGPAVAERNQENLPPAGQKTRRCFCTGGPLSNLCELCGIQLIVKALFGHQLCRAAGFQDAAVINNEDAVGVLYGGQAVGDDEAGAVLE